MGNTGNASRRAPDPAIVREEVVIARMVVRIALGPIADDLDRWVRAFRVVAGRHKLELDFQSAKRCEDAAVQLRHFQRTGRAMPVLDLLHVDATELAS
jgi:hypothetical protein